MPFTRPTVRPVASITTMIASPASTDAKASAPTTDESATMAPTERSTPRVTMTSSWPIARTLMTAVWARTLPMLRGVRKTGSRIVRQDDERNQHQHRAGFDEAHDQGQEAEPGIDGAMAAGAAGVADVHDWDTLGGIVCGCSSLPPTASLSMRGLLGVSGGPDVPHRRWSGAR